MNKALYARAIHTALVNGLTIDQALTGLQKTLARHGHESLYGSVLREVLALVQDAERKKTATIVLAKALDEKTYTQHIEAFMAEARASEKVIVIDESIIGGFIAKTTTVKRNQSYKESLIQIYRSVTAH